MANSFDFGSDSLFEAFSSDKAKEIEVELDLAHAIVNGSVKPLEVAEAQNILPAGVSVNRVDADEEKLNDNDQVTGVINDNVNCEGTVDDDDDENVESSDENGSSSSGESEDENDAGDDEDGGTRVTPDLCDDEYPDSFQQFAQLLRKVLIPGDSANSLCENSRQRVEMLLKFADSKIGSETDRPCVSGVNQDAESPRSGDELEICSARGLLLLKINDEKKCSIDQSMKLTVTRKLDELENDVFPETNCAASTSQDVQEIIKPVVIKPVQKFDLFCLDTNFGSSADASTSSNPDVAYSSNFKPMDIDSADEEVPNSARQIRPKMCCFNCEGEHSIKDCPEPVDGRRVAQNRSAMMAKKAMNMQNKQAKAVDPRFAKYKPGVISDALREALGLKPKQLPPWIYMMRKLSYPPGYLIDSEIRESEIQMYDDDGKHVENESALKLEGAVLYDTSTIIDFPGFNTPLPEDYEDECRKFRMPPMQEMHSKEAFVAEQEELQAKARKRVEELSAAAKEDSDGLVWKRPRIITNGDSSCVDITSDTSDMDCCSTPPPPAEDQFLPPPPPLPWLANGVSQESQSSISENEESNLSQLDFVVSDEFISPGISQSDVEISGDPLITNCSIESLEDGEIDDDSTQGSERLAGPSNRSAAGSRNTAPQTQQPGPNGSVTSEFPNKVLDSLAHSDSDISKTDRSRTPVKSASCHSLDHQTSGASRRATPLMQNKSQSVSVVSGSPFLSAMGSAESYHSLPKLDTFATGISPLEIREDLPPLSRRDRDFAGGIIKKIRKRLNK